jgi:urease gamma subunit
MMNRHPVFYCFPNLKYLESQAIVWYKVWTCITHFHSGHFTDEKDIKRTIDEAIETISKYIISYGGRFINELVNTGEFTGLEKKKIKSGFRDMVYEVGMEMGSAAYDCMKNDPSLHTQIEQHSWQEATKKVS